jgi:large subunit ribosomal protein L9
MVTKNRTKLLLVKDVEGLGRSGEVVEAKPGHARNFIIPQGYGVIADKQTLRMQERLQQEREKQAIIDKKDSEQLASRLEGMVISTVVKVDQEGHMFGSVSQMDVIKLLDEKGIEATKKMVQLPHPIKTTGVHTIELKLKEDVPASVTVKVIPDTEKELPELEEAPGAPPEATLTEEGTFIETEE